MANGTNRPFGLKPIESTNGGNWTEKRSLYYLEDLTTSLYAGDPVVLAKTTTAAAANSIYPNIQRYPFLTTTALPADTVNSPPPVLGVFDGCEYYDSRGELQRVEVWQANTAIKPGSRVKVFVFDDPDTVFEIQVSSSLSGALNNAIFAGSYNKADGTLGNAPATAAYFSQNFDFGLARGTAAIDNPATGSLVTRTSAVYLDVGSTRRGVAKLPADLSAAPTQANFNALLAYERAAALPLKAKDWNESVETILDTEGNVKPFLKVKVVINNHVFKAGTVANRG